MSFEENFKPQKERKPILKNKKGDEIKPADLKRAFTMKKNRESLIKDNEEKLAEIMRKIKGESGST